MYWDRPIEVQDVRARWLEAHALWSRPFGLAFPNDFPDADPDIQRVSSTLAVVAGRAEMWEAQAHVVVSCSTTGADPADLWLAIAGVPHEQANDLGGAAIAEILPSARRAVPLFAPWSFVWSAEVLASNYAPEVLNETGYVVGQMAGGTWEECKQECGSNPPCILACLRRGSAAAAGTAGTLVDA